MEHGKTFVVLAGDGDVLHPGIFGQPDDGFGIKLRRIECFGRSQKQCGWLMHKPAKAGFGKGTRFSGWLVIHVQKQ